MPLETHNFSNSTMIASAQYDSDKKDLTVTFCKSARPYKNSVAVPQSAYDGLISAESAGRYYNAEIAGKYGMVKV